MPETLVFYLLSGLAIVTSALVIGQRNPMYSVLLLVASFGALAGLYIQLDAPFVAVAQIIIYAGAVMVLFLFVVMLLNAPQEDAAEWDRTHPLRQPAFARFGALLALLLVVQLVWALLTAAGTRRLRGGPCRVGNGQLCAGARTDAVHRLRVRVRSDVDSDPRGDGRRGRPCAAGRRPTVIPLGHYLIVSAILFSIGTAGVFLRRNLITILLSIEIMLNAVNLSFVAFGRQLGSYDGQIITFFVIAVAAAEAAVGLAIIIALYRHRESLNPDAFTSLRW